MRGHNNISLSLSLSLKSVSVVGQDFLTWTLTLMSMFDPIGSIRRHDLYQCLGDPNVWPMWPSIWSFPWYDRGP